MRIVGFVPAKGSSERLQSKNRTLLHGVPLFLWAANNLARVLPRDCVFVDSDSAEIRALAELCGFGTIERPAALATNATDGNALLRWEASQVSADIYVQHLPPMAFLAAETLTAGIAAVESGATDSALGARFERVYPWTADGRPAYDIANIPNSFTLPETIAEGMGLYVTRHDLLAGAGVRVGARPHLLRLDRLEAIDIDWPEDLEFARIVAAGLSADSPYLAGLDDIRAAIQPALKGAAA